MNLFLSILIVVLCIVCFVLYQKMKNALEAEKTLVKYLFEIYESVDTYTNMLDFNDTEGCKNIIEELQGFVRADKNSINLIRGLKGRIQ